MSDLLMVEAINDAFHTELARDDTVLVMGEDVGRAGGVFRATAGLRDRFGPERCVDTPLAEAEAEPDADIALLFENAYASPPASFAHDLAELRRILGGGVG